MTDDLVNTRHYGVTLKGALVGIGFPDVAAQHAVNALYQLAESRVQDAANQCPAIIFETSDSHGSFVALDRAALPPSDEELIHAEARDAV